MRQETLVPDKYIANVEQTVGKLFEIAYSHGLNVAQIEDMARNSPAMEGLFAGEAFWLTVSPIMLWNLVTKNDMDKMTSDNELPAYILDWSGRISSYIAAKKSLSLADVFDKLPLLKIVNSYKPYHSEAESYIMDSLYPKGE